MESKSEPTGTVWHYGGEVHRLAAQLCHHPEDAEDVAQSTLMKAAAHLDGFRGEATLRTWLHRIATNECRQLRRRRVPASLEELAESHSGGNQATAEPRAAAEDPADAAIQAELRAAVLASLEALAPLDRTVLLLREGRGLSVREIAGLMSATESSVRSRLHRSRVRLRQAMQAKLGSDVAAAS